MSDDDTPLESQLTSNGVDYIVYALVDDESNLYLEVEEDDGDQRWSGSFSPQYVEELTRKTGNFKRFKVFCKMLFCALADQSETVFVDLLTFADLESFKGKKGIPLNHSSTTLQGGKRTNSTKRFLILTYAAEFDRVHYPLPLHQVQTPSASSLLRTIRRLRQKVVDVRHEELEDLSQKESTSLREENMRLRRVVESFRNGDGNTSIEDEEVALLRQENLDMQSEIQRLTNVCSELKKESLSEVRSLRREARELLKETQRLREQLSLRDKENKGSLETIRLLKKKLADTQKTTRLETPSRSRNIPSQATPPRRVSSSYSSNVTRGRSPVKSSTATDRRRNPAGNRHSPSPKPSPQSSPRTARTPPRFDPTAYVREREQRLAERRSRSPSINSSPRQSRGRPDETRGSTFERSRQFSRSSVSPAPRPPVPSSKTTRSKPSPSRNPPRPQKREPADPRPSRSTYSTGSSASPRIRADERATRHQTAGAETKLSSTRAFGDGKVSSRKSERTHSEARSVTPRKASSASKAPEAADDVQKENRANNNETAKGKSSSASFLFDSNLELGGEISDIDKRLKALQNFVKQAKAGTNLRSLSVHQ